MKLTTQQIDFFETFGFIKLPGLVKDDVNWIIEEFQLVFPMFEESSKHDGKKRTVVVPFIDQREKLSALLEDPRIYGIATSLLGDNFNYMGSDGNYYSGNTGWHPDGNSKARIHIKIAFYLEELTASTGALRVIPGSHRLEDQFAKDIYKTMKSQEVWGIPGSEVPAVALDVSAGDILVFNHNTFHSSWGGGTNRKMFTMNLSERFHDESMEELRQYITIHATYRRENYYGSAMLRNASPQRMKHLEQVISVSSDFYELSQKYPELHPVSQ